MPPDQRDEPEGADRRRRGLPSLLDPPIGFAHRGARVLERENTLAAFELALRLGATGLESDAWLTADGVAVLDHDGRVRSFLHSRPIGRVNRAALPRHIPTVDELFALCGPDVPVSIDVKDGAASAAVVDSARRSGAGLDHLYLCTGDLDEAARWSALDPHLPVVHSTRLRRLRTGPERHVAAMAEQRVKVLNLHYEDWTAGLVALCHRFGVLAFGWDAQHARQLDALLAMGCDGVYCDHPDRLADALRVRAG